MTFRKQLASCGRGIGAHMVRIHKVKHDKSTDSSLDEAQVKARFKLAKHNAPKDRRLSLLKRAQPSIIQNAKTQMDHRLKKRNQQIQKSLAKVQFVQEMTKYTNPALQSKIRHDK